MRPLLIAALAILATLTAAERSPLVLSSTGQIQSLQAGDVLRLPIAGPFYTALVPAATADRDITLPDATTTLAGYAVAGTWTAAQNFSAGTTTIATADINSGAIDGTAIGAASPSTGAFTTLTATGTANLVTVSGHLSVGVTATLPNFGTIRVGGTDSNFLGALRCQNAENGAQVYINIGGSVSGLVPAWQNNAVLESTISSGVSSIIYSATAGSHIWHTGASRTQRMSLSGSALTLASGVNLAMSGASTATFGTGAFTVNGAATINNTLTVTGESTFRDPVYFGKAGTGTAGSFRLLNDSAANQWFVGISGAVADKDYIMYDYTSTVERLRVTQSTGNFGWVGPASFSGAVSLSSSLSVSGTAATITSGAGTPEAAVTAPVGSLFMRTDGGASTTLYVKESGVGNTGWVAK